MKHVLSEFSYFCVQLKPVTYTSILMGSAYDGLLSTSKWSSYRSSPVLSLVQLLLTFNTQHCCWSVCLQYHIMI